MEDTIVAISTPLTGESGIGIVRMSGKDSISIAEKIFTPKNKKSLKDLPTFTIHYGWVKDDSGKMVDEVLLSIMKAPKTYTREDIVEISCHGGQLILRKILQLCIKNGARLAEPGEFTKRAFLNGRIDLIQAESVCDMINSRSLEALEISAMQMKGELSKKINIIKNNIADTIAEIEATIDFPEEETGKYLPEKTRKKIQEIIKKIKKLLETAKQGKIYREGINIAIVGKPNVGKSSLLNRLISKDRAIVTPIPGTTRDVISETFNLSGIPVKLMDTAGIKNIKKSSIIDKLSERKTFNVIDETEFVILVCDISVKPDRRDISIAQTLINKNKKFIVVLNKKDLVKNFSSRKREYLKIFKNKNIPPFAIISALKNKGINNLKKILIKAITSDKFSGPDVKESVIITNIRHENILNNTLTDLRTALLSIEKNESPEFTVFHLRNAVRNLGEITGEVTNEDILQRIFSNFCIGK